MLPLNEEKHAYKLGNNPASDDAYYSCTACGIELYGTEVGYVGYGRNCANGEHSPCIRCGEENSVFRGEEND